MAKYHNDEPTLDDLLDRLPLVREIGDTVAACDLPAVFGIHGDWGAGKTSFLQLLQLYLTGICPARDVHDDSKKAKACATFTDPPWAITDNATVVWFEAWRYQNEIAPIVALLQETLTHLDWFAKTRRKVKKETEIVIRSALLSMEDLSKKIGIQASKIESVGLEWETANLAAKLPAHVMREQLELAISQILKPLMKTGENTPRVVILIDDLDRCQPQIAFKLLESIKLYLNLKNCVVVLGMDQKQILQAIQQELSAKAPAEPNTVADAREYLEKICQNCWNLPLVLNQAKFLENFLPACPASESILEVVKEYSCLHPNPRKLKAVAHLLNRCMKKVGYQQKLNDINADRRRASLIVIMVYLYQFHSDIYRRIEYFPEFYGDLVTWCSGRYNQATHPLLTNLEFPMKASIAPQAPPGDNPQLSYAHPDPVSGNVLRVQKLISDIGNVPKDEIRQYLFV